MTLVVLADGVFAFFFAWEAMSLLSFFLVLGNGRNQSTRRAAYVYLVMTHIGTGFLLVAFFLLARHAGALDFATLRASAASLDPVLRDAVFLLALVGLGTKAGLIPLHVWLPRAHPAAPSHVSALMSGVMVKTAVYGMVRLVWEWAAPGAAWWGALLLIAGGVSAVLGILYALMERDLKRVLAYSTVEHVGIITLGLGAAVMFSTGNNPAAAALALAATLFHLFNHAIFKGLLFLGAGAVQTGTGTRDLERLGGLIRLMPRTAVAVLIGSIAIAALPPLNGFAGEWLLLQSLLPLGQGDATPATATLAAVAAAALALTGALALACFVRAFGVAFLGQARTEAAVRRARGPRVDAGRHGAARRALSARRRPAGERLDPAAAGDRAPHWRLSPPGHCSACRASTRLCSRAPTRRWDLSPVCLWSAPCPGSWPGWSAVPAAAASRRPGSAASTWSRACSTPPPASPNRSASSSRPPSSRGAASSSNGRRRRTWCSRSAMRKSSHPVYEQHLYERGVNLLLAASHQIRRLQSGSLRAYLTYLFVTLVVVLVLSR